MTRVERYRKARRDPDLVVLEGFHPLKHALRFGVTPLEVVARDDAPIEELAADLAPDVAPWLRSAERVAPGEFDELTPRPVSTGVLALARRPRTVPADLAASDDGAPIVLLDGPTRLGNLGASIRVAAAASASGLLSLGDLDPWSPEAVRGAAGLQFALPVARSEGLPASPRPLVALCPDGRPLGTVQLPAAPILAFGSERSGLSSAVRARADLEVAIPMREGVSSLNLATSVAIALYFLRLTGPPGPLQRPRGPR